MTAATQPQFPTVGDGTFLESDPRIYREELQLAFRNKAIPLEALRYDVTPVGMHYTLTHYDIPLVDTDSWRLQVGGLVEQAREYSLPEITSLPSKTLSVTLECAGDGRALTHPRSISQPWLTGAIGNSEWTGVRLADILNQSRIGEDATEVVFTGLDEGYEGGIRQTYQRSLPMGVALSEDVILASVMNGHPLEPQHGFPLRLIVPGWYGMAHVKWLAQIDVIHGQFDGYQQSSAYRYSDSREEPGQPVEVMRVRSLMIPPGLPDFLTRTRVVHPGIITLQGRAWSGFGPITRVEFSDDGGKMWDDTVVGPVGSCHAWQEWTFFWNADCLGPCELCCRATDAAGNTQPDDQYWTARGMGNNGVHRVSALVVDS